MTDTQSNVKLMKVSELTKYSFYIPDYQRGYKWSVQQVDDLLDDLNDFFSTSQDVNAYYCLQPLVVKAKQEQWEVVDGQQRLTTIFLLLSYLGSDSRYSIQYATRPNSADFLNNFPQNDAQQRDTCVDYYHMCLVFEEITNWFKEKKAEENNFKEKLLQNVRFIWYECTDDAVKVFTRINIGKIGLTNAELIKALLLDQKHMGNSETNVRMVAEEWNRMETELQNDEFWYFLHAKDNTVSTRMDMLFDIIRDKNLLSLKNVKTGTDKYKTFRYFDAYFKQDNPSSLKCWDKVRALYYTLREWYNDVEYYHYIGYLVACSTKCTLGDLYNRWGEQVSKDAFLNYLKNEITKVLKGCCKQKNGDKPIALTKLLDQQYEVDAAVEEDAKTDKNGNTANTANTANTDKKTVSKTVCRPILILHNVQQAVVQNKKDSETDRFHDGIFYRFPFYLLKSQSWDVEHIDSNATNQLTDNFSRLSWLLQYQATDYLEVELKGAINDYIAAVINKIDPDNKVNPGDSDKLDEQKLRENLKKVNFDGDDKLTIKGKFFEGADLTFDKLRQEIEAADMDKSEELKKILEELGLNKDEMIKNWGEEKWQYKVMQLAKNRIGNYTLLDSKTNRSYGNSIFPRKRRTIMDRDQAKKSELVLKKDSKGKWYFDFETGDSDRTAFVPAVTRNVFMKYYTPSATEFIRWTSDDRLAYKQNILETIENFLKNENEN